MESENNSSTEDKSFLPKFIKWPLDMGLEDDEFRAGYPFRSTTPVNSNVNNTEQKHKNIIHHLESVEMVHLNDQISTIPTREIINGKPQENTDFVQNDANRSI
ncbi:unnamed protein product [Rotaria sp. Silwood2]|nr:unnamed protein product [Rotaria sp. Silwood2]CAF3219854.1 unnamed protein product [Rotaria sp. Silwood2]